MGSGFIVTTLEKLGFLLPRWDGKKLIRLGFDVPLLLVVSAMLVFGLLMVYSASADFSFRNYGSETYTFVRQVRFALLGVAAAFIFFMMRYQAWEKYALPLMVVAISALILVFFLGEKRLGATRSFSGGSYQPSELAKLVIVVYLSVWLYRHKEDLSSLVLGLLPTATILAIVGVFIAMQPDTSAVLTIILLGGMLFFLAGGGSRQIFILAILAFVVGLGVILVIPTGMGRIKDFLSGIQNLLESSDHVKRSVEAFVAGGWFGVGIGKGQTKLTGLPFPHTDSIFAVIGEETGVFGAALVVLGYLAILWRGLSISRRAPDALGRLLAGGLTFWIMFEASLNMAVLVGLMPFAGNALPFFSAGGSSLMVSLAAVGILLSISRQVETNEVREERNFDAVVDLRWRDGRRRVPRTVRFASTPNKPAGFNR